MLLDTEIARTTTRGPKHSTDYADQERPVTGEEDDSDSSEYLPSDFEANRDDSECEDRVTQGATSNSDTLRAEQYSTGKAKSKKLHEGGAHRQARESVLKHKGKRKTALSTDASRTVPSEAIDTSHIDTGAFLLTDGNEDGRKASSGVTGEHLLSVREAFAGDDVVEEFVREKEKEVEKGKPKDVDLTLPGEWSA